MRLTEVPQSLAELIGLATAQVPTPLFDAFVALLLAKTVIAATAVGVFDALNGPPLTDAEIVERCATHPTATEKLLRALCACKYLKYEEDRYSLTPMARRWLPKKRPQSLHSAVLHRELDLRFMNFQEYVLHGTSQNVHCHLSPEDWQLYHDGQASHAALFVDEVLAHAPIPSGATDLLDLGGAHGLYSFAFCNRYPKLRARVLDLAITNGQPKSSSLQASNDRVQFEVADLRTTPLPPDSFDVILLANLTHHLNDAVNYDLIHKAADALRPHGVLIVIDAFRPRSIEKTGQLEALLNLYFGAASGVGLWTLEHIQEWCRSAGLALDPPRSLRFSSSCKLQLARKTR